MIASMDANQDSAERKANLLSAIDKKIQSKGVGSFQLEFQLEANYSLFSMVGLLSFLVMLLSTLTYPRTVFERDLSVSLTVLWGYFPFDHPTCHKVIHLLSSHLMAKDGCDVFMYSI